MVSASLVFFTYFTSEFIEIGIVCVERIHRFHPNSKIIVYVFDQDSFDLLSSRWNPGAIEVRLVKNDSGLERVIESLAKDRNPLEVVTSLKPHLLRLILDHVSKETWVVYVDPDVMFYRKLEIPNSQEPSFLVFEQLGLDSAAIRNFGRFNAGLVAVKNNLHGRSILLKWEDKCFAWCRLSIEDDKYADQKYLDIFSHMDGFESLRNSTHNLSARAFARSTEGTISLRKKRNAILINGKPLQSFHFHSLRVTDHFVLTGINRFGRFSKQFLVFMWIYLPILFEIAKAHRILSRANFQKTTNVDSFDKSLKHENYPRSNLKFSFEILIQTLRLTRIPISVLKGAKLGKSRNMP